MTYRLFIVYLCFSSLDGSDVGSLYVMAWENVMGDKLVCRDGTSEEAQNKEVDMLITLYAALNLMPIVRIKIICKTNCFQHFQPFVSLAILISLESRQFHTNIEFSTRVLVSISPLK
jgi:hypothetical protein